MYVAAAVILIQVPYTVNENDREALVPVVLSSEVPFSVTLFVNSIGGIATSELYYAF